MVFVLEDITKIEADRIIGKDSIVEPHEHRVVEDFFQAGATVRAINRTLETYVAVAPNYQWQGKVIGCLSVFTDAFLNAGMWGNQSVPGKKIKTTIKYGWAGSVIYVEDEGEGFDFAARIAKLEQGQTHDYHHHGGGMTKFHESKFSIGYHGKGNIISISTPLSAEEMQGEMYQDYRRFMIDF